jgi:hypothetical protein
VPSEPRPAPNTRLLVGIYGAHQIRRIDPGTGDYTNYWTNDYGIMNSTADAHGDSAGNSWCADWGNQKTLGRIASRSLTR